MEGVCPMISCLKIAYPPVFAPIDLKPRLHAALDCAYLFYVALKWQHIGRKSKKTVKHAPSQPRHGNAARDFRMAQTPAPDA
jgi:hypothetical protein